MSLDRLQADKKQAESSLTTSMELKSVVVSLFSQSCDNSLDNDSLEPVCGQLPDLTRQYLGLQERLSEARTSANHWSRKKVRHHTISVSVNLQNRTTVSLEVICIIKVLALD